MFAIRKPRALNKSARQKTAEFQKIDAPTETEIREIRRVVDIRDVH